MGYLREEARKRSIIVLVILILVTIGLVFTLVNKIDEEQDEGLLSLKKYLAMSSFSSTVCYGFVVFGSKHKIQLTELLGPSIMTPHIICIVINYYSGQFTDSPTSRTVIPQGFVLIYLLVANFLSIDYVPHLLMRLFFGISCSSITINNKN